MAIASLGPLQPLCDQARGVLRVSSWRTWGSHGTPHGRCPWPSSLNGPCECILYFLYSISCNSSSTVACTSAPKRAPVRPECLILHLSASSEMHCFCMLLHAIVPGARVPVGVQVAVRGPQGWCRDPTTVTVSKLYCLVPESLLVAWALGEGDPSSGLPPKIMLCTSLRFQNKE